MEQDRYTITYREAEARQVMSWIGAGQSGCLIGLRGAGKSNFLRFLLREDVQQHYLAHDCANTVFVLVSFLALTERTEWAVYELILDRLLAPVCLQCAEEASGLTSRHRRIMRSRDPLAARQALEQCVGLLCQRPVQRVVLLLDEFDAVFQTLDPSLFRCLRAIRDAHKGQVVYIVVVADELTCLRDDLGEVEHFLRLVTRNVCNLGPYCKADAQRMACYLAAQRSLKLSRDDAAHLVELSGGHAGLLKATLSLLWSAGFEGKLAKLDPVLANEPALQAECRKVWDGLLEGEQGALCALASGLRVDPAALGSLQRRGLVRETGPQPPTFSMFSPLFADFVRRQTPPSLERTVISRSPPNVQIDGRPVADLTELEFEVLCTLYERRGQVCTKDELIEHVYRLQYDRMKGGVTDGALQTLISRLRAKIEPDPGRPRYVVTVRGVGYKLVEPDAE